MKKIIYQGWWCPDVQSVFPQRCDHMIDNWHHRPDESILVNVIAAQGD